MAGEKRNFDQDAALWDDNPGRVKVASDIARTILAEIPLTAAMDVLDFGCGTGLVTLALQPFVRSITGVDSSRGMLDVLNRKVSERGLSNVVTRYLDHGQTAVLSGSYHLVVSSMTFHHIRDVEPLLKQFHSILQPSGILCIADLDEEGGRFHESNDGVFHFGFDRAVLARQLENTGFRNIRVTQAAQIEKPVSGGASQRFTVFLMIGMRF
jgi:ubiquinone/menaquinone biosynthesis C-methylase UbiE